MIIANDSCFVAPCSPQSLGYIYILLLKYLVRMRTGSSHVLP